MEVFIMGAITMASWIIALFFLRFWHRTGDRLFGMFAISFLLLGITRVGLVFADASTEGQTHWYWVRLVAFLFILAAIIDKNRQK
jgi:hypothetical protein